MPKIRKSKSPYQKYAKKPYKYSALYYDWARAARPGSGADSDRARELGQEHTKVWLGIAIDTSNPKITWARAA